jgi:hypothetical protein
MNLSRTARRATTALLALATVASTAASARADDEDTRVAAATPYVPRPPVEEDTEWYGWQTLVADGASLIVLPTLAGFSKSPELGVLAGAGYLLAPPFIHGAHGRWGIFAASLGLRLGMPLALAGLGALVDGDCRGDFCLPVGAAIGFVSGVIGAVVLDASVLSYEKVSSTSEARRTQQQRGVRGIAWQPTVAPRTEGGFTLGLGATF